MVVVKFAIFVNKGRCTELYDFEKILRCQCMLRIYKWPEFQTLHVKSIGEVIAPLFSP